MMMLCPLDPAFWEVKDACSLDWKGVNVSPKSLPLSAGALPFHSDD